MSPTKTPSTRTTTERVASLVLDESIYPRSVISENRVSRLAESMRAGAVMPALIAEKEKRRLIDGVHRSRAYLRVLGPEAEAPVEWRTYTDDKAAFADAALLNAVHGEPLSSFDLAHCLEVARRLDIPDGELPAVLSLTVAKVEQMRSERFGTGPNGEQVLLKRSSRHLAGHALSTKQVAGNAQASGMKLVFHVNQIVNALENGLVDPGDTAIMVRLRRLCELIDRLDAAADLS
jgi:hypothetical protein